MRTIKQHSGLDSFQLKELVINCSKLEMPNMCEWVVMIPLSLSLSSSPSLPLPLRTHPPSLVLKFVKPLGTLPKRAV